MDNIFQKIVFRINKVLQNNSSIPGLVEKRKIIEKYRKDFSPSVFIETGTFLGDTVEYFRNQFNKIYSIELSEELAKKASNRFLGAGNIHIIQGNSEMELPKIVSQITGTALFWLDGHYSSEFFVKDEFIKTAKGETNTPVVAELEIILGSSLRSVVLIDDARLFNGKEDYPTIKHIKSIVRKSGKPYNTTISDDIIQIIPAHDKKEAKKFAILFF
jgi:hypothetical protein